MIESIFYVINEILWFLFGSQTAALTTIGLGISAILFHKSGAGRDVYPLLLRTTTRASWWTIRTISHLISKIGRAIGIKLWNQLNFGVKRANASRSTTLGNIPSPQSVQPAKQPSTGDDWVVRTLKSMGFTAAEAQAAAGTPEVAAETTLDDQVRVALVSLNPLGRYSNA